MKIKKLFLVELIIALVLILSLNVIFASNNKSVNNIVYSETNYAKYYSELIESNEWKQVFKTRTERVEAAQIPEEVLKKMNTDELIEAVIKYPLLCELYAYNEFRTGFEQVYDSYNGIRELLNRDDAGNKLINFYNSLNDSRYISEDRTDIMNLQIILAQPEFTNKLDNQQIEVLLKSTRTVYRNENNNFFDICANELLSIGIPNKLESSIVDLERNIPNINARDYATYVPTPEGTSIPVTRSTFELSDSEIRISMLKWTLPILLLSV